MPGALAQRVPVALPSTARFGVMAALSLEDDVAGLFSAMLVVPQAAGVDVFVAVAVRVGVSVGPTGVLVRVAVCVGVNVGPTGVLVRVRVRVGVFVTALEP